MKFKLLTLILLGMSAGLAFAQAPQANASAKAEEAKVHRAVDAWLATMDGGKHGDAWKALATSAAKVDEPKWTKALQDHDNRFGKRKGRRFDKLQLLRDSGSTGQPFYLVQFLAIGERGRAVREVVRVVKDNDANWRVAGYTVEPQRPGGEGEED